MQTDKVILRIWNVRFWHTEACLLSSGIHILRKEKKKSLSCLSLMSQSTTEDSRTPPTRSWLPLQCTSATALQVLLVESCEAHLDVGVVLPRCPRVPSCRSPEVSGKQAIAALLWRRALLSTLLIRLTFCRCGRQVRSEHKPMKRWWWRRLWCCGLEMKAAACQDKTLEESWWRWRCGFWRCGYLSTFYHHWFGCLSAHFLLILETVRLKSSLIRNVHFK